MIIFPKAEIDSFERRLKRLQEATGRSTSSAMRTVGGFFVSSAAAATPKAKKKRKIVRNEEGDTRWAILRHTQKGVRLIPIGDASSKKTEFTNDPRREIKRRGLAKAAWKLAGAKASLKRGGSIDSDVSSDANRGSEGRYNGDRDNPEYIIHNVVPYIETLDRGGPDNPPHHILSTAMLKSGRRLDGYLKRIAERQAREWSR